jgi:hypothetical protein
MPHSLLTVLICTALSLTPTMTLADPPTPPAAKLTPSESKLANLLTIQLEFEDTQYKKTKSDRSFKKIISLREKLIQLTCMPKLRTSLSHSPEENSAACQEQIDWMKSVIPLNPAALCAEHGTTSPSCGSAFDTQYIGSMDSRQLKDFGLEALDLELRLADLRKQDSKLESKHRSKVYNIAEKLRKKATPELRAEFETHAKAFIQESCSNSAVVYLDEQPGDHLKAVQITQSTAEKDDTKQLIKEFEDTLSERKKLKEEALQQVETFKKKREEAEELEPATFDTTAKPTPTPVERKIFRMRYISRDCESAIKMVNQTTHSLPHAICAREGFMAPRCLAAVAAYRKRETAKQAAKRSIRGEPAPSGLGTF